MSISSGSQRCPIVWLFGAWLPPSRKNQLLTSLCGVTQDVISPVNGSLTGCPATRDLEKESLFVGVLVISTALACLTMQVPGMSGPCQACLRSQQSACGNEQRLGQQSHQDGAGLCLLCTDIQ